MSESEVGVLNWTAKYDKLEYKLSIAFYLANSSLHLFDIFSDAHQLSGKRDSPMTASSCYLVSRNAHMNFIAVHILMMLTIARRKI